MKTKTLITATLFLVSLGFVCCQKDINPFSPQMDGEKSTDQETAGNVASTSLKAPEKVSATGANGNQERRRSRNRENDSSEQELAVEIQPSRWNINWTHSEGLVTVWVYGSGFEAINPASLRMVGPEGDKTGEPLFSQAGPFFAMAKFSKSEAIGIIPEPVPGQTYDIQVIWGDGNGSGTDSGLSCPITIVGNRWLAGELKLEIRPNTWNIAWANAKEDGDGDDLVTARISGKGFDQIEVTSAHPLTMSGPTGASIAPVRTELTGICFQAKFTQKDAISLIPSPPSQSRYEITVSFYLKDGTSHQLSAWVTVKGKRK